LPDLFRNLFRIHAALNATANAPIHPVTTTILSNSLKLHTMKLNFRSKKFRILIYNSTLPIRKVKENLSRYGFDDVVFVTAEDLLVNTVKGLDPGVVIIHHHSWNDPHTPALIKELRKSCDVPVLIWSEDLNELISRKLLSFKNTYTLRISDGLISLTEILQRIEMKIRYPALWV
jgi:hypothetical protein